MTIPNQRALQYRDHVSGQSPLWRITRICARVRANNRCEGCEGRGRLECAHLTYDTLGHEHLDHLAMLCPTCHDRYDDRKGRGDNWAHWMVHRAIHRREPTDLWCPDERSEETDILLGMYMVSVGVAIGLPHRADIWADYIEGSFESVLRGRPAPDLSADAFTPEFDEVVDGLMVLGASHLLWGDPDG